MLPQNYFKHRVISEDKTPDRIVLTESELKELIRGLVFESLSISDEVNSVTHEILRDIIRREKTEQTTEGKFNTLIFGKTFTIRWKVFTLNNDIDGQVNTGAYVNFKTNEIFVNIIKDWYGIDRSNLSDAIQHEIEHIFQKSRRPNETMFNEKDSRLYDSALRLMSKYKDFNDIRNQIGRVVYLMFNAEQDAYVNGLYSYAKSEGCTKLDEIIRYTEAGRQLLFLVEFNNYIRSNDLSENKQFIEALDEINRGYEWLKRHTNKAISRFSRKISHIERKLAEDEMFKRIARN